MIFIPGHVPSKKNKKRAIGNRIISNPYYLKYIKATEWLWVKERNVWLREAAKFEKPYLVGLHFVRENQHKFDYINPAETIQDLMQKFEWVLNDDCEHLITFPFKINGNWFSYNPEKPGVYITLFHALPFAQPGESQ